MTDDQNQERSIQQVTFRELRSGRLRRKRFHQLSSRLLDSLTRKFGSLKCESTFQDFIAEAICSFYEQCRGKRAFADNDRPVFPYLLKSAQHAALASLSGDGKTSYEKARRLECSTTDSEIAFDSLSEVEEANSEGARELQIAEEFKEVWAKLSDKQQYVLEANANANANGYELRAEVLGEELGAINDSGAIHPSTVRQYKSRALKLIRQEKGLAKKALPKLMRIEHEKTR